MRGSLLGLRIARPTGDVFGKGDQTVNGKTKKRRPFFRRPKGSFTGEESELRAQRRQDRLKRMKKGIFIFPSLLTLTSIFFSFYSIICAMNEQFRLSGALIIIAAFFDALDGRVARLTKTTSRFGVELDSLADVISFGVAPALLMYLWALTPFGRVGWMTAFVFVACGALRLARFNVQTGYIDPRRFVGLPIPAAAGMVATTVMFFDKVELTPEAFRSVLLVTTYLLSFLMVSNIRFHAFKDLGFVKAKPFTTTVGFVLILTLIGSAPFVVPFFLCAAYVLSGPIMTVCLMLKERKAAAQAQAQVEPEAEAVVETAGSDKG
jgi:CDP-diacylglycerol--serine O-phosphatidyltransferase